MRIHRPEEYAALAEENQHLARVLEQHKRKLEAQSYRHRLWTWIGDGLSLAWSLSRQLRRNLGLVVIVFLFTLLGAHACVMIQRVFGARPTPVSADAGVVNDGPVRFGSGSSWTIQNASTVTLPLGVLGMMEFVERPTGGGFTVRAMAPDTIEGLTSMVVTDGNIELVHNGDHMWLVVGRGYR